ncbi:sensor histidine kinase [Bradyrhizobium diazoefficiens]|jgi:two-component sensor histidine kinase|nr:HWE histidine kinase domain-containing protein [Bradyrhizobium diazoefficiens]UCF53923.1 MAG: sensor histidine kinase [Bradyrhizobium sp.]MBR0966392.1 sensor histidine kinase [Bradyrhizobium diazoefficiens]MBR0980008.1 sensor histidine kinase [Bradyrhizobium diazoefficiens]MBR1009356.1 sensor histidine kinase [Bradyrhizobium diazoefficiens]MBR1015939.1 sensor histidine kinase [Bradyrhizobium diazoefficiens]
MDKLIDDFRKGWQAEAPPSLGLSIAFAVVCLLVATLLRWGLAQVRPDVYFIPYFPAVFLAAAFGGLRIGIITALAGGVLGVVVNFSDAFADRARFSLLTLYWGVSAFAIWGVEHYRTLLTEQRRISRRLIEEEEYRKLLVDELQHRLKNKLSTVHAVLHQVLQDEPQVWARIDPRLRSLAATDDLISRIDKAGCDIRDLLISELGPYGHVRFTLNGDRLFLPPKLAVTLSLMFHELATNASKYGAFSAPNGLLQVSWTVSGDRLTITWDESEGPSIGTMSAPGFGTKLLKSALSAFDGKTEISYLATGLHCIMQCRVSQSG